MKKLIKYFLSIVPIFILAIFISVTAEAEEQVKTISLNETVSDTTSSKTVRYNFKVDKAGYVTIDFSHVEKDKNYWEWKWEVKLYDSDDILLTEFHSAMEKLESDGLWLEKGNYYVLVSSSKRVENYLYNLTVNYKKPKRISVNKTVSDTITKKDDIFCYEFTLDKAGYIKLDFIDDREEYAFIELYNTNNIFIGKGGYSFIKESRIGLPKGNYYIKVTPGYYKEHQIRVNYKESSSWEKEPNNSDFNQIKVNQVVNGSNVTEGERTGDNDYFYFILPKDGYINIEFSHMIDGKWKMSLLGKDGKVEYILNRGKDFTSKEVPKKSKSINVGLKKGKYFIKLYSNGIRGYSEYKFKVNYKKASNWEKEFNNTISTANSLKINSNMKGNISEDFDIDYYKIKVNKKSKVQIKFNHKAYKNDASKEWKIILYDSKGKKKYIMAPEAALKNFASKELTLSKGTYYISISAYTVYEHWSDNKKKGKAEFYGSDYDLSVTAK